MSAASIATALSIGLGLMASTVDDRLASPLTYRAWGPQLRVGADRPGRLWFTARVAGGPRWSVPIGYGRRRLGFETTDPASGEVSVRPLVVPSGGLEVQASTALLAPVGPVWLGGGLRLEGRYTASGHALGSWADSELGLEARVFDVHPGPRWTLQGGAALHLIGVVTRFPYGLNPIVHDRGLVAGFFQRGSRLTTPRGHQAVRLTGRAHRSPEGGRHLQPYLEGELSFVVDRSPEPLVRTRAVLVVGVGGVPREAQP